MSEAAARSIAIRAWLPWWKGPVEAPSIRRRGLKGMAVVRDAEGRLRFYVIVISKFEAHLVDVAGRPWTVEMKMDIRTDAIEVAAPSDALENEHLKKATASIAEWMAEELAGTSRGRFARVQRVCGAMSELIRAAEPSVADFDVEGEDEPYQQVGGRIPRVRRMHVGAALANDHADLTHQLIGLIQPGLQGWNEHNAATAKSQRAREMAELLIARKNAPEGPAGEDLRRTIDARVAELQRDMIAEAPEGALPVVTPEAVPDGALSPLLAQAHAQDPANAFDQEVAKVDLNIMPRRVPEGDRLIGPPPEPMPEIQPLSVMACPNCGKAHRFDDPCPTTALPAAIERGSRWVPQSGDAFHAEVTATGPNHEGLSLVSFTVHPDDGSRDVSMLGNRRILLESTFREQYKLSNDAPPDIKRMPEIQPLPVIPAAHAPLTIGSKWTVKEGVAFPGSQMFGLVAEITAEGAGQINYTTTRDGKEPVNVTDTIDHFRACWEPIPSSSTGPCKACSFGKPYTAECNKHIVWCNLRQCNRHVESTCPEFTVDAPIIIVGSTWRNKLIPGHLATVAEVLSATGDIHVRIDTGMGSHADSYTRYGFLSDWEPLPKRDPSQPRIAPGSNWVNKACRTTTARVVSVPDDEQEITYRTFTATGSIYRVSSRSSFLHQWEPAPETSQPAALPPISKPAT